MKTAHLEKNARFAQRVLVLCAFCAPCQEADIQERLRWIRSVPDTVITVSSKTVNEAVRELRRAALSKDPLLIQDLEHVVTAHPSTAGGTIALEALNALMLCGETRGYFLSLLAEDYEKPWLAASIVWTVGRDPQQAQLQLFDDLSSKLIGDGKPDVIAFRNAVDAARSVCAMNESLSRLHAVEDKLGFVIPHCLSDYMPGMGWIGDAWEVWDPRALWARGAFSALSEEHADVACKALSEFDWSQALSKDCTAATREALSRELSSVVAGYFGPKASEAWRIRGGEAKRRPEGL